MAIYEKVKAKSVFMGKLAHDGDLLGELTDVCRDKGVRLGKVEAIGAVRKARIGFYDQARREYSFFEIDKPLEITRLSGNVSLRDGEPMVHVHITLADSQGNAFGGHLAEGTIVFACEFVLTAYEGPQFNRSYDEQTGLPLWDM